MRVRGEGLGAYKQRSVVMLRVRVRCLGVRIRGWGLAGGLQAELRGHVSLRRNQLCLFRLGNCVLGFGVSVSHQETHTHAPPPPYPSVGNSQISQSGKVIFKV